jgi:hypothetical protein
LTYFGLIVVLFTAALLLRRGMDARAEALEVREASRGEVELDSSALRLSLSGLRGVVVCYLWYDASQNKQVRHDWSGLEQRVRLLVKLQPHFVSPWLFQSWNLAYNVSVEFDRIKDKYFYIARGIGLLAQGERQNRDNSQMRFFIGNYTQSKMGISDENNTLRTLYQMSCMDPRERDADRFRNSIGEINWVEFEDFCTKHPHLVRRLHDRLNCRTADDVIDFLKANFKIPSRYDYAALGQEGRLAQPRPLAERYPALPPRSDTGGDGELFETEDRAAELGDDTDNYAVSRAWYQFAQDPLERKDKATPRIGMARIIFVGYPARAQFYVAERREEEGWFDADGWEVAGWFPESASQPDGPKRGVVFGAGRAWAAEAWDKAHQMYRAHGERHGLYKTPEEVRGLSPEELREYTYNRGLTNFDHFFFKSQVEMSRDAVAARKRFFQAEGLYKLAEVYRSLQAYEQPDALGPPASWSRDKATGWKRLLLQHPDFRRDEDVQEDSYTIQRKYLRAFRRERGRALKTLLVLQDLLGSATAAPGCATPRLAPFHLPESLDLPVLRGPFDDTDAEGQPLIGAEAVRTVNSRVPPPKELGAAPPSPEGGEPARLPGTQPRRQRGG